MKCEEIIWFKKLLEIARTSSSFWFKVYTREASMSNEEFIVRYFKEVMTCSWPHINFILFPLWLNTFFLFRHLRMWLFIPIMDAQAVDHWRRLTCIFWHLTCGSMFHNGHLFIWNSNGYSLYTAIFISFGTIISYLS